VFGKIINKEKFEEEHRQRIIHSKGRIRLAYLDRYEQYAYENSLKVCRECYKLYEKNCTKCSEGVK